MGLFERIFMAMIVLSFILTAGIITLVKVSEWLGSNGILAYIISAIVMIIIGIPIAAVAGKWVTEFLSDAV